MDNEFFKHLKANHRVYYIYRDDLEMYNPNGKAKPNSFIVVVKDGFFIPAKFNPSKQDKMILDLCNPKRIEFESCAFTFYSMSNWFKLLENNDLTVCQCMFLKKKNIYKEHVKLNINLDPLKLRANLENNLISSLSCANIALNEKDFNTMKYVLWNCLKNMVIVTQLYSHNKIYNLLPMYTLYTKMENCENTEESIIGTFDLLSKPLLKEISDFTDDKIKKLKIDSYKKKLEEE